MEEPALGGACRWEQREEAALGVYVGGSRGKKQHLEVQVGEDHSMP